MSTMAQRVATSIQKIAALHRASEFTVGDTVLYGKWKNQRGKVIRFFDDERGVPSVEVEPVPKGRKQNKTLGLYKIWKTKEERQKQACVIFSTKCDGNVMLGKVRDRMYDPEICVYHLEVDGTEVCIMFDRTTGFCEGINEHGLGIVNSSLMVLQDEREGVADGDDEPERSPDGIKIVKALSKRTIPEALRTLIMYTPKKFQQGLKGHTLVSDGTEVYALENTRIHTPKALKLAPDVHRASVGVQEAARDGATCRGPDAGVNAGHRESRWRHEPYEVHGQDAHHVSDGGEPRKGRDAPVPGPRALEVRGRSESSP